MVSGKGDAVGLPDRKLQVRSFHVARNFLTQFRKEFCHQTVRGNAFPVLGFKKLFTNHPLSVDEKISGTRHSLKLAGGFVIHNLVLAQDLGIRISEHGKIYLAAIGEGFQDRHAVIADRSEFDPLFLESCLGVLQLDQLPFAIGSPIRGTEEEEHRSLRSLQTFQRLFMAELVASGKRWRFLADGKSNRSEYLKRGDADGTVFKRPLDRYALPQMPHCLR